MEVSYLIVVVVLDSSALRRTSKLKRWRCCYARFVSCIPWRRVIDALAKALLRLAVRIMEDAVAEIAVTFVVELFRSQIF